MRITEIKDSDIITLDRLKAYANIVDSSRDDDLRVILKAATLRVAQYADVALVECVIVTEEGGRWAQLWMPPVAEIINVTRIGARDRNFADVCELIGNRLLLPRHGDFKTIVPFTVTYRVQPEDAQVELYAPYVLQMAVAMWDGNTDEEQKVYKRIPAGYVVY